MKSRINRDTCIACGNCYAICPEVYDCDEDGIAYCILDNNAMTKDIDSSLYKSVIDAFECCPTGSVVVESN